MATFFPTITSANAVYMLSLPAVFPVAQQLEGFGVDEAFDTEPADTAEVRLGVDGLGVAGWIPRLTEQNITLLAASSSFLIFENWVMAQDVIGEIIYASAIVLIPSIARKYSFVQGALTRFPALPNVKKVLADRQFRITWMPPAPGIPAVTFAPM
jgi:hypothetical protein